MYEFRKEACIEFWQAFTEKLEKLARLDDAEIVFGAFTQSGHQYRRLPVVPEKDLADFERRNGFVIPLSTELIFRPSAPMAAAHPVVSIRKWVTYNIA